MSSDLNRGEILLRGWRLRCPRCGQGALFRRGLAVNDRCSSCNLQYQRNNGDTWMFMIITDRIPLLFGIAAMYFGFIAAASIGNVIFFFAMAVPILSTIRRRQGLALALDYLFRVHLREQFD